MPPVASDAMIRRLETELEERNAFANGLIGSAQEAGRDLTEHEQVQLAEVKNRMKSLKSQFDLIEGTAEIAAQVHQRARDLDGAIHSARRGVGPDPVEFTSAGHFLLDAWKAHIGDSGARDRMDIYTRAAAHQRTTDNLGIVPDPIVGPVVNFIDATRPIVSMHGTSPMTTATWYRPKVTQHTTVAAQGAAGAAADEKTELVSQKMTITRITGQAKTYGGYVNVSRQDIDFSSPNALDTVVTDLAAQYAIQTEAAMGTLLNTLGSTLEVPGVNTGSHTPADLTTAIFTALATVYAAVKGAGRYYIACSPDKVGIWAPLFAPVNPNPVAPPANGAQFGNGIFGYPMGIPLVVSAGLAAGTIGVLTSTAAVEPFEQRVGQLQTIEPSVLGVQVAYAGYFSPVTIESTAGVRFIDAA